MEKTMTSGQAFQLAAVITQNLGKIGLDFDTAQALIDKQSTTRQRLKALLGKSDILIAPPPHQYATLEALDIHADGFYRHEDCGEFLTFKDQAGGDPLSKYYYSGQRIVHKCTVSDRATSIHPVLREVLAYDGPDDEIWNLLHERGALWTVQEVLGVIREQVHEGKDPLGLTELDKAFSVFPILLTTKVDEFSRTEKYPDRVGTMIVTRMNLLRQKQTWHVELRCSEQLSGLHGGYIYFANNTRPEAESKK